MHIVRASERSKISRLQEWVFLWLRDRSVVLASDNSFPSYIYLQHDTILGIVQLETKCLKTKTTAKSAVQRMTESSFIQTFYQATSSPINTTMTTGLIASHVKAHRKGSREKISRSILTQRSGPILFSGVRFCPLQNKL